MQVQAGCVVRLMNEPRRRARALGAVGGLVSQVGELTQRWMSIAHVRCVDVLVGTAMQSHVLMHTYMWVLPGVLEIWNRTGCDGSNTGVIAAVL